MEGKETSKPSVSVSNSDYEVYSVNISTVKDGKFLFEEDVEQIPAVQTTVPQEQTAPMPVQMPPLELEKVAVDAPVAETPKKESPKRVKVSKKEAEESATQVAEEIAQVEAEKKPEYCYPPIELLKLPGDGKTDGTAEMRENTRRLNEALASFKIDAHIINVTRGPSVTRYEVELAKGVRLSKLTTAADDLALNLGATGVRIAPIPDRVSVVGIEVPNRAVNTVSLREVIDSKEFSGAKSKSSFAILPTIHLPPISLPTAKEDLDLVFK